VLQSLLVRSARRVLLLAVLVLAAAAPSHAGLLPTYPLGTTPGTWQVDRYPPNAFSNIGTVNGRSNVLDLGISTADSLPNRPPAFQSTFYNTQGRGFALDLPTYSVLYGSVYLPSAWGTSSGPAQNRRSDLWGVLSPASGGDTCPSSACNLFPIVDFTNASPSDPINAGGTGRYRVFDTSVGFVDLATPVAYDQWSDLCTAWTGADIRHYVNGVEVYVQTDLTQADTSFGPPNKWTRTIVQGYNFGADYQANWSGIGAGQVNAASASAGSGQTAPPGASFAQMLTVTVVDAGGAPVPCVPVTFTAPASGASASLSATTVVTGRDGAASVSATANATLGTYSVSAQTAGVATPTAFALTNAPVAIPVLSPLGLFALALTLAALGLGTRAFARAR
jgi:hypothetical protein